MGKQACTISRMVPTNKEASPLTVGPQPPTAILLAPLCRHSKSGQGPDPRFKRAGGTGFRASGTGFRASGTGIKAGGTGIRASGTGIWPKVGLN